MDDERQINRWKGIVSRFKGKLIKMIKYVNGRFDDYSISPKIRQIYELVESDLFFVHIKMGYYWLNRQKLLQKGKDRYHNGGGKEKTAEYYLENREVLSIETCQKKKKNQKENMEEIRTKTLKKCKLKER